MLLIFMFALICASGRCDVRLPRLISDGMVLQRATKIKLWGWADPGESIQVSISKSTIKTVADAKGNWMIQLDPMVAGGPHLLTIDGKNHLEVRDILIGDVWLCSGQSNMELTMERVKEKYRDVFSKSHNDKIRHFTIPDRYNFQTPEKDITSGRWISASPKDILEFSAVAYFFALDLYEKYQVPIGLVNAALGGSPVEAWISEDALKNFPDLLREGQRYKDNKLIVSIDSIDRANASSWYKDVNNRDEGLRKWNAADIDDTNWAEMTVPGYWADTKTGNVNGAVWFRKKIIVPEPLAGNAGHLWMGRIIDADSVFLNGQFVGATGYQYPPRRYQFKAEVLKGGENVVAVRVINNSGRGGFVPEKPYFLSVDKDTISLNGTWKYKVGAKTSALPGQTFIRWKPFGLYNGMISPLVNYGIKGVIWYQGEANTSRAKQYEELFPALIGNWRDKWNMGDFPFLFVQLPNFMEEKKEPSESHWAELRHAQLLTAKNVINTGMAVAIDVGEWNDIHPLNKRTVGKRHQ
jgi:sialate O-acetylesterase